MPLQKKEIRINIGQVEVKAPPQAAPVRKTVTRGFDDYLMARIYMDRRYF
jgi:hypothetical protein